MTTEWVRRAVIIASLNRLTAANNSAASWDPDTGGDETFGAVRLSTDGQEPATHTACNTLLTDSMRDQVLAALDNIPFIAVYFRADGWDWRSALADAGLQVIEAEDV